MISEKDCLWSELNLIRRAFVTQGYPIDLIHRTMFNSMNKTLWPYSEDSAIAKQPKVRKTFVSVPFIPQKTKMFQSLWKKSLEQMGIKTQIGFTFKPDKNLASILSYKPNSDFLKTSGVVYGVKCQQCDNPQKIKYIGETSRTLKDRINSHLYAHDTPSSIRDHITSTGHKQFDYVILARESYAAERKIAESILIRKFQPEWNRDQGIKLLCV